MNFKFTKKKAIWSIVIALAAFLFIGFFLRCFPLGCVLFDSSELVKVLIYVSIPVFVLIYIIWSLIEKSKTKSRRRK
jgi:antibiotic biosynthesis monooxygenase (ABM) superfamily enzyme